MGEFGPPASYPPLEPGLGSVVYRLPMESVAASLARLGQRARSGVMVSNANPRIRIS